MPMGGSIWPSWPYFGLFASLQQPSGEFFCHFCSFLAINNVCFQVIMVKPDGLSVQEIKIGSKAKIVDIVAIRHGGPGQDQRTTLILLCEDGSLKIYMAGVEATGYWLSPKLHPLSSVLSQVKPPRKKRPLAGNSSTAGAGKAHRGQHGALTFPIDFFEHCSVINDVEYGGNFF